MAQQPARVTHVPPRPIVLPDALNDEEREWCAHHLELAGRRVLRQIDGSI